MSNNLMDNNSSDGANSDTNESKPIRYFGKLKSFIDRFSSRDQIKFKKNESFEMFFYLIFKKVNEYMRIDRNKMELTSCFYYRSRSLEWN